MNRIFTGFRPFLDHKENPSWLVAKEMARFFSPKAEAFELPVVFGEAFNKLKQVIESQSDFPDQLWLFGLASNRNYIGLERVALNWVETCHPDEGDHLTLIPHQIFTGSPDAFILKNHPFLDCEPNFRESLSIKISHSAGTYVCNDLYYRTLRHYSDSQNRIVFVHVPSFEVLSLETQVQIIGSWVSRVSS